MQKKKSFTITNPIPPNKKNQTKDKCKTSPFKTPQRTKCTTIVAIFVSFLYFS